MMKRVPADGSEFWMKDTGRESAVHPEVKKRVKLGVGHRLREAERLSDFVECLLGGLERPRPV